MSDKQRYTPGPWRVIRGHQSGKARAIGCNSGGIVNFRGISQQCKLGNPEANAFLIAAAPELYEALCDMVSDRDDLSQATIQFALAALAKARGES